MDKELKEAIKSTIGKKNMVGLSNRPTTEYNDDTEGWNLEAKTYKTQRNYLIMLDHLPNLMSDTEKIGTVLNGMLEIIAQQQQEILELKNLVKCAVLDKTKVVMQKNLDEQIKDLLKEGSSLESLGDISLNTEIQLVTEKQSESNYQFEEKAKQFNSNSKKIGGGLKGLLSILASLDMGSEEENSNLNDSIKKIDEEISNSQKIEYKGKMTYTYKDIKRVIGLVRRIIS